MRPQWPVGMLWWDDTRQDDLHIPVIPLSLAQQMYEALVNLPPGNVEVDAAVLDYERIVGAGE